MASAAVLKLDPQQYAVVCRAHLANNFRDCRVLCLLRGAERRPVLLAALLADVDRSICSESHSAKPIRMSSEL
jgi:hypothetical protein